MQGGSLRGAGDPGAKRHTLLKMLKYRSEKEPRLHTRLQLNSKIMIGFLGLELGRFVPGTFGHWDVLSLRKFCPLERFVLGRFVCAPFISCSWHSVYNLQLGMTFIIHISQLV